MPITWQEVRDVPLADLARFPGNARRGDIPAIRASLADTGQYRSLVVRRLDDGSLVILAGNNTHEALEAEGAETARCEIITCTDAEATRINVKDNHLSDLATDDPVALLALLESLDEGLDGTGFGLDDVTGLRQITGALGADATGFLRDFADGLGGDPGTSDPGGGQPGGGEPDPRPGSGFVQVSWAVPLAARDTIRAACLRAQQREGYGTAAEGLLAVARHYLETTNRTEVSP